MSFKQDLIRLGTTNPNLRPHIRQLIAGCEKLPEGGMRDNCEKKKEEGGKDDAKKEANDAFRADLIKLGTTNPELRPQIREILAGCEKLPEGGMRDNCEAKKNEGGEKKDDKKEAADKTAAFVNRLPMQYHLWADKVLAALSRTGDQERIRNTVFAFNVYLLSLVAPEQAILVDRLLARSRRAPVEEGADGGMYPGRDYGSGSDVPLAQRGPPGGDWS